MARALALLLALFLPGLPLARAAGIAEKGSCAAHQSAAKRLPCHAGMTPATERAAKHDCCEIRFARDLCTCGHGDEASGLSREPSLAAPKLAFVIVREEAPLGDRPTAMPACRHDPPDPRPPSLRS